MKITQNDIQKIAQELLKKPCNIFTFTGSLGAGKTTLVQAMLQELGVQDAIQSPTYTYLCVYTAADGRKIYHFDLYRLTSLEDFMQAGFEEYVYDPTGLCFIEWPEIIMPLLDKSACHISLGYLDDQTRELTVI